MERPSEHRTVRGALQPPQAPAWSLLALSQRPLENETVEVFMARGAGRTSSGDWLNQNHTNGLLAAGPSAQCCPGDRLVAVQSFDPQDRA